MIHINWRCYYKMTSIQALQQNQVKKNPISTNIRYSLTTKRSLTLECGANIFGLVNDMAARITPLTHLVLYQACKDDACEESSQLGKLLL